MSDAFPEVTRFVVKLPPTYAAQSHDLHARLGTAFPGRKFTFEPSDRLGEARLAILPVMEDGAGKARVCRVPDRSLINSIHEVFNEFVFGLGVKPA